MSAMVQIGSIRKPHGLKGELKIQVDDRFLEIFLQSGVVFLVEAGQYLPYFISEVKGEQGEIIKFEDIDTREAAESLQGAPIYLKEELAGQAKPLGFEAWAGFEIFDSEGVKTGTITEVREYPQQWMAFVQTPSGKEVLIPLIDPFILEEKKDSRMIVMELPEGLLDL